jgi:hypothetical protein
MGHWRCERGRPSQVVTRKRPELLAVNLVIFDPCQLLLHTKVHRPTLDAERVAGVPARAPVPPVRAKTAAVGIDADKSHRRPIFGGTNALGKLHVTIVLVIPVVPAVDQLRGQIYVPHLGTLHFRHVAQE